jgi:hypothetical protein
VNKRILSRLAQAGHFNTANGTLYAATKLALRKSLNINHFQMAAAAKQETLTSMDFSPRSTSSTLPHHPKL